MRTAILQRIQALDPERDHKQIVYLSTCFEFPFDTTRSLEFALFRTFCVPSVSDLLDRTGEFRQRPQKRPVFPHDSPDHRLPRAALTIDTKIVRKEPRPPSFSPSGA